MTTRTYAGDAYATYRRAEILLDAGMPADTAALLEPLHQADPANAAVVELLGRGYFGSAQLVRAEGAFRRLVELRPDDGWAHIALARTLERQSRRDEAATHRQLAGALGVS